MRKQLFAAPPESIRNVVEDGSLSVQIKNQAEEIEVLILEQIGADPWDGTGVIGSEVRETLKSNRGKPVNVAINSPGGLVNDGLMIYNVLAEHEGKVTVTIEGLAYSAASFIAMAGDHIRMHENSDIGIHRAWGFAMGNRNVMMDTADWLEKTDDHLIDIYQQRTGQSRDQIIEWIDGAVDGTLFSAKEAVENGFADELIAMKKKKKPASKNSYARRAAAMNKLKLKGKWNG